MQTNYERYCKMSSLAQIGWWEADFLAGHYVCSDFLCDLLGLEGDTISFMDFQNLIREDYREQIVQEFRANANIHKDFYEQTFPICLKNGEVWLHTRLALREKGTGTNGGDKSFGVIQRVEAPKEVEQKNTLRRVNDLLRRQNYISPVSYTHLDVYKRQILSSLLASIRHLMQEVSVMSAVRQSTLFPKN